MKAEELMIGDWVFNPHKNKNERISGITLNQIRLYGDIFRTRKYNPIPITQEILKKNGFKKFIDEFVLDVPENERWEDCEIWVNLEHESLYITRLDKTHDEHWSQEEIHLNGIINIHELQHALRLCDINIDIKL